MVCIAAFIILLVIGIVAALISIFNRDFGHKYLALLKKSFHCFFKRVRLQKCDTNFSEDVKTTLLKKVVIKKPKLVKPLSITIEIVSFALVILTAWSIIEAAKAGLALWVFGTCNVSQPSNCALGAESCSIDENNLNWFTEWGEIFSNIPDRLKTWNAADYLNGSQALAPASINGTGSDPAIAIIDPGCSVCLQSYKNLKADADFLNKHTLYIISYPIHNPDGSLRFKNSEIITRYILATNNYQTRVANDFLGAEYDNPNKAAEKRNLIYGYSTKIIDRIFTQYDQNGVIYQSIFNDQLSNDEAAALLDSWLTEWGMTAEELSSVQTEAYSETVESTLRSNREIIDSSIKPKGIPTMIYDGKKHLGLYKK